MRSHLNELGDDNRVVLGDISSLLEVAMQLLFGPHNVHGRATAGSTRSYNRKKSSHTTIQTSHGRGDRWQGKGWKKKKKKNVRVRTKTGWVGTRQSE